MACDEDHFNAIDEELTELTQKVNLLFEALRHGDEEHQAWLQEAISSHFAGLPIPHVRGND